jgi:pimeloyl-ACP methyl ester carboxylesterase
MAERMVHVNGVDLCVESFGDAAGPLTLLLHGAGSTMLSWDEELCGLIAARGRHVMRVDSRDAGRSVTYPVGAPPYSLADIAGDIAALIGSDRAHLVAVSGAGIVAQLLALEHPERVASLTLASTTPGNPADAGDDLPGPAAGLFDPRPAPDWSDRAAVVDHLVETERPFAFEYDEAAGRELAGRVFDRARDIEASVTNAYLAGSDVDWPGGLGSIAVPTLVVHGAEDPLFPLEHGRALARAIPGASLLVLERTGHEYFPRHTWDTVVPAITR